MLFQLGDFRLHSGARAAWKVECDALTPADWQALAVMAVEILPSCFGRVEGVPRGGIPFADALRPYCNPQCPTLLIAEDVCTTGDSMERYRAGRDAIGVCAFARGRTPSWVSSVWVLG